jgi:transposase
MQQNEIFALGLGLTSPWELIDQRLDVDKTPNELHLRIEAERGSLYPCPICGKMCKAHDFKDLTWRHLNFFQHHCFLTAPVPRTNCPDHGVKRVEVPWARKGSHFTLLFEQAAMTLVREMPVLAAARIMEITDQRLWRVVNFYVQQAMQDIDLSNLEAFGLDETASKRGHNYVTVFIDLERDTKPVIFATPGKGKRTVQEFKKFLERHGGQADSIVEVVCDMSKAFLSAAEENFPRSHATVDWFHVVQLFTKAIDEVRRVESKDHVLPKSTRWAVLKASDKGLTESQIDAIVELEVADLCTAKAWRIRETLRWVNKAASLRAAKWRMGYFINYAKEQVEQSPLLQPVLKALETLERHKQRVLRRWRSTYTNARLEGLNSLFQAARSRA